MPIAIATPMDAPPIGATLALVEDRLAAALGAEAARWESVDASLGRLPNLLDSYLRRGGKRLRPAFLAAGVVAAGGDATGAAVVDVAAALELLHAFALIHDDVMDGSTTRAQSARPAHRAGDRAPPRPWPRRAPAVRRGAGRPGRRPGPRLRRPARPVRSGDPGAVGRAARGAHHGAVPRRQRRRARRRDTRAVTVDLHSQVGAVHDRPAPAPRPPRSPPGPTSWLRSGVRHPTPSAGRSSCADDVLGVFGAPGHHRQARRRRPPGGASPPSCSR